MWPPVGSQHRRVSGRALAFVDKATDADGPVTEVVLVGVGYTTLFLFELMRKAVGVFGRHAVRRLNPRNQPGAG